MVKTSDISKIKLPEGSQYDLKDTVARQTAEGKLDKSAGAANSGAFMVVNSSGNIVPEQKTFVTPTALASDLAGKVDVAQPNANAGDLLAVDASGNVTPQTIPYATQSYADGIIKAGSSEPTDSQTKLWINTSDVGGVDVYTQKEIDAALDNKVDKVDGKGLSTNDFTDAYLDRLLSVANGAQVNVIETIQLNGTTLSPTNKTVNIVTPVPETMTSDEAKAGTSTTAKLVSAKALNDAITNKGYTQNVGTVTGVTINGVGATVGNDGVVDLGTVLTQHQDITGKQDKEIGTQYNNKLLTVSGGKIAASSISTNEISTMSSDINGKVAISQGQNKAGRYMVVNQDGNVEAQAKDVASTEYADGLIQMSETEPETAQTKIWIDLSASSVEYVPTMSEMQSALATKLDGSFTTADAGKFLVVGSDGQITAVTMQQWQAGSY